jgi:hypothetical protein
MLFTVLYFIVGCAILGILSVSAMPTGAAGCGGNGPAVGGPHLQGNLTKNGTLEHLFLSVTVDESNLTSIKPINVAANLAHTLYLLSADTTNPNYDYRGFLFRLSHPTVNTLGMLQVDSSVQDQAQIATVCTDIKVAGVTHTNNQFKQAIPVTLFVTKPVQGLVLDVTVVRENRIVNKTTDVLDASGNPVVDPTTQQIVTTTKVYRQTETAYSQYIINVVPAGAPTAPTVPTGPTPKSPSSAAKPTAPTTAAAPTVGAPSVSTRASAACHSRWNEMGLLLVFLSTVVSCLL